MKFLSIGSKSIRFLLLLVATYLFLMVAIHNWPSQLPLNRLATSSHRQSSPFITHASPPFLGINTALEQYDPPTRRATLARLHATGFGWVRQRLDWGELEPMPGHYRWTMSDALMQDILAAGLVPVIVLDGSPAWARAAQDQPPTNNPFAPPADFNDFARFAAAFAARYDDQLTFYQIWDEPNIAPHWGNRLIEPVGYAQLLKVTAQAIRATDPNATIISAALAPTRDRGHTAIDEVYYLQRLYAAGAAPYFDLLAIQPFGFGDAPADPRISVDRLNFGRAQLLHQTMVAAGDGATPIWAVRYGWNRQLASPWATVSEENQWRFATEALTLARDQWPWLTAIAWAIDQPDAPTDDPSWGFALSEPLAAAFQTWQMKEEFAKTPSPEPVAGHIAIPLLGMCYLVGLMLVGWRTLVVGRQLPWARWGAGYRGQAWWVQAAVWMAIVLIYAFATWPPLILLCWLVVVMLLRWQPHVGLWLAAALMPFYAQHKEFMLGGLAFAVAPSHAVLICLALGLLWDWIAFRGRAIKSLFTQLSGGASPERRSSTSHLALAWLLINLLSARNVWQWPAYAEGLWDLVLMPLLGFWLVRRLLTVRSKEFSLYRHWRKSELFTTDPPAIYALLLALFAGGVAVAVVGLVGWWRGIGTEVDGVLRLVGPYYSANQAAFYLERTLFLGLGLAWAQPRYRRWLGTASGLILVALLLTASRGALLLGVPAGVALWGWWRRRSILYDAQGVNTIDGMAETGRCGIPTARSRLHRQSWMHRPIQSVAAQTPPQPSPRSGRGIVTPPLGCPLGAGEVGRGPGRLLQSHLILILIALIGLGFVLLLSLLGDRLTNSATVLQRLTIWQSALALWRDFFWFGVGPGGFFWRYPAYLPLGALDEPNLYHPHNLWLELATGWGMLGLLWLGMLLWWLARRYWQLQQERKPTGWLALSLLAAFAAGLAHAQVDAFLVLPDLALWTWLVLALLGGFTADDKIAVSSHRDG